MSDPKVHNYQRASFLRPKDDMGTESLVTEFLLIQFPMTKPLVTESQVIQSQLTQTHGTESQVTESQLTQITMTKS
jgi:hypothetical protein